MSWLEGWLPGAGAPGPSAEVRIRNLKPLDLEVRMSTLERVFFVELSVESDVLMSSASPPPRTNDDSFSALGKS
jgi:hypothetical protein